MNHSEALVNESTLTPRQVEALRGYIRVAIGEMKYREAALAMSQGRKRREPDRPLTIGSYFRTVQQARENVRKSIVTLLIGIWLGVVKPEDAHRLLDIAGSGARELSDEEADRFVGVLHALLQKIVM